MNGQPGCSKTTDRGLARVRARTAPHPTVQASPTPKPAFAKRKRRRDLYVRHRHGLCQALQAAGVAALISSFAGEAVSIKSLAVTLPTVLLQSGYSRKFEDEADSYAFQRFKEIGLSPRDFAEMLTRLEEFRAKETGAKSPAGERTVDYLSTHPATAQRIERARASQ